MKNENFFFLPSIIAILFVTLKLCNVIGWSWWWVLSPLWIAVALAVVIAIIAVVHVERERKRNRR